mmetsp:Transcript_39141/g.94629  ORF Transcript_39141/g.94629 Transcript_39141/m.94629 type:complete len:179 (+) Transcript_39141:57-593(+)
MFKFEGHRYPELEASEPKSTVCCLLGGPSYAHLGSNPLSQEFHTVQLRVPEDANDTYRGNSVTVQHVLSVVLVSNGCCNSNPESATMMQLVKSFSNGGSGGKSSEPTMVTPSAPSDLLDDTITPGSSSSSPVLATAEMVVAEAQVLPPDWNAQTAQVVEIPMAEAMVIEPSAPPPIFK